jgi:uncharacterized protein YkwD
VRRVATASGLVHTVRRFGSSGLRLVRDRLEILGHLPRFVHNDGVCDILRQPQSNPPMTALSPDVPQVEVAIVEMTNTFRAEQKLGAVKPNPQLVAAARAYAEFLARSDMFSHTADGRQHADRAVTAGYRYCQVSENLSSNLDSRGFETRQLARDAVEGWKKSPGHRLNLIAPHVTEIGVGVAKVRGAEKYISVQMFGRPDSLKYQFKIQNGLTDTVTYRFGSDSLDVVPQQVITHWACAPEPLVFERAGPPLLGRRLTGSYLARDGDLFTLKAAPNGGVIIDVSSKVAPTSEPARAAVSR